MGQEGGQPGPQRDITSLIRGLARLVEKEVEGARVECDVQAPDELAGVLRNICLIEYPAPLVKIRVAVVPVMDAYDAIKVAALSSSRYFDKLVAVLPDEAPQRLAEALESAGVAVARVEDLLSMLSGIGYKRVVVKSFYVKPAIKGGEVERLADKYRGWLFKRGSYAGSALVYLPIYVYTTRLHRVDYSDEILESAEASLSFDAISGSLVGSDRKGTLLVMDYWVRLGDLGLDEVKALEVIAREGAASIAALRVALDREDVQDIVGVLLERGIVDEVEEGLYVLRMPNLTSYRSPFKVLKDRLAAGRPEDGSVLDAEVRFSLLRRVLSVFGEVVESAILYYPIYILSYAKRRDNRVIYSYIAVSGVSGERMSDVEEILMSSNRALSKIDSMLKRPQEARRS